MVEKCKPEYKNVNTVKSFSEQSAATVQVMNRICKNEEYLYQETEKLSYLTPPAVRKRFNPVVFDPEKSYGCMLGEDNNIIFDSNLSYLINIDFKNMNHVDTVNSTCIFEEDKATIARKTATRLDTSCKNWDLEGMNSAWYCGYDKSKAYQVRPDWLIDPFDCEIPGVCRAQTIVIPEGFSNNGNHACLLEGVTLHIKSQGENKSNWGSPLYVQLWNVEPKEVDETEWKNNKNVPTGRKETVYIPRGNPNTPLAECVFYPDETNPINYTFVFDKAIPVNTGEHYAIVMLSPLSHWDHAPRIGGWGRNCNVTKDNGGDAFLSEDNGRTWIKYGRNDDKVEYALGQKTPQDFAFQAHIRVYDTGFDKDNTYYLYLNPICDNQIKSIYVSSVMRGDGSTETNCDAHLEVSLNGKEWSKILSSSPLVTFDKDNNGNYPSIVFLRGVLSTDDSSVNPYIDSINVIVNKDYPKEMYVRTPFFHPKVSPMLGANIWGRVYAPFEAYPSNSSADCNVEIIQETICKEHFHIITVNDLDRFLELKENDEPIIDEKELGDTPDKRAEYLINHPSVLSKLKKFNVYVKPYTLNEKEYLLSFEDYDSEGAVVLGGLKLSNSPAYPLESVIIQPFGTEMVQTYGEHYDFDMNYTTDVLTFVKSILDDIPVGALSVSYNKVFIQDLTLEEIGDRVNSETGLNEQGLILDYFKEDILVSEEMLESRHVPLRVVPVDPLREVQLIREDDEITLYEDIDFTVDYTAHELIFPVTNITNENSRLQSGDELSIVYTPNLEDTGIAIGYRATRSDTNHQLKIKPNYIEYK